MAEVHVLRIGHRPGRDKRVTTHVCLVARAFGATKVLVDRKDKGLEETMTSVDSRFGGHTTVITGISWRKEIRDFNGLKVHLTMYGLPLSEVINDILNQKRIMVVIGSEKVPSDVYHMCDLNVSIGSEPHSEIAALAVFLDRVLKEQWSVMVFENATTMVIPQTKGKCVISQEFMERNGLSVNSADDTKNLLKLLNMPNRIIRHTIAVNELSMKIARRVKGVDMSIVNIGSILHDIGRLRTHGIWHAYVGSIIVRILGYPDKVVQVVRNHIGAGITKEEAVKLGLPPIDFVPKTIEEKIVAHADNLIREDERVPLNYNINRFRKEGLYVAVKRMLALHKELSILAGIDLEKI